MTRFEMIKKLEMAQQLMGEVYRFANDNNIHMVERSLSCADTCVGEAIEYIQQDEHELLLNDVIMQLVIDVQNKNLTEIGKLLAKAPKDVLKSYLSEV